ncbi:hypothetical protein ACHAXH_009332 [Discostella pseudostelligera]
MHSSFFLYGTSPARRIPITGGERLGNRSTVKKSLVGANDYRQRSKFSSFQIKAFMCNHDRDKRFRESVDESIDIDLPIMI